MRTLDKIAKYYGTDKSSEVHNYCEKYERYFPFDRLEPLKILEIGILNSNSLKTWREFYPHSNVVGIDINPDCANFIDTSNNIDVMIGSQDDSLFLNSVVQKHGPFDMILDDGSHINRHVIKSFECLFHSVKPFGIYVVEDATTSYWNDYEGGYRKEGTSIEYFKKLVDDVNFNGMLTQDFWSVHARKEDLLVPQAIRNNMNIRVDIESINFLNGIIIITKR